MNDAQVNERYDMWQTIPCRLSGSGYIVAEIVEEIRNRIDDAQIMINQRHVRENEELTEREESFGIRGSGRKNLETKHKREIRRFRMDELQFGFSTLTKVLHRQLLEDPSELLMRSIEQIRRANGALRRNPNESLLLQALLISLSEEDE
jgi:DNA polymerase-3 subunit delta'